MIMGSAHCDDGAMTIYRLHGDADSEAHLTRIDLRVIDKLASTTPGTAVNRA
jgi:hypothetical protein